MRVDEIRMIYSYTLGFIAVLYLLPAVDTSAYFTRFPPNESYVSSGGTARFEWEYHADNRGREFQANSPIWSYYNESQNSYRDIGSDDKFNDWIFVIFRVTCPPRLLNPDRVSRELPATLVISSVTTADNGIYRCMLLLRASQPIRHQVQLVVTVRPTFLPIHPSKTYQIIEGQDLKINCTAIGPPTPNITWVNTTDGSVIIMTQGSGSAVLRIDNILRYHAGVYECRAKNNPNEIWTSVRTSVFVYYKPAISKKLSTKEWNGRQVTLKCIVNGLPTPTITWYKPNGQEITTGVTTDTNGSHVTITTTESCADYGLYKCQALNIAGRNEHFINVTQLFAPGAPNVTISDEDIQASSVTVRWTKPDYDGGSPVIDYKVQIKSQPPQEHNTARNEHTFTGLDKNIKYEIRVYAKNAVGYGYLSKVVITTKTQGRPALPDLLVILLNDTYSKLSVAVKWTRPDANGGSIARYSIYIIEVSSQSNWKRMAGVTNPSQLEYTITKNIVYGGTYKFIVTAWNRYGESVRDDRRAKSVNTTRDQAIYGIGKVQDGGEDEKSKQSSTVVEVIATLFVLSLLVNVLLAVILWRRIKRNGTNNHRSKTRKTTQRVNDKSNIEMRDQTLSQVPQQVPEYASIQQVSENTSVQATACPSSDEPSQYQELRLPAQTTQQEGNGQMYEPLRVIAMESSTHNYDTEPHPYESLNNKNESTDYQSLKINTKECVI